MIENRCRRGIRYLYVSSALIFRPLNADERLESKCIEIGRNEVNSRRFSSGNTPRSYFSRREGRNWSRLGIFFRHVARGKLEWRRSRVEGKQRRDSREERKKKSEGIRISCPSSAIRYVWRRATDTLWVRIVGVSDRIGHPCVIHRIP